MSISMKNYPPRPKATPEMVLKAAKRIEELESLESGSAEEIARYYRPGISGFELALELHRRESWEIQDSFIEFFGSLDDAVDTYLKTAEFKWERENNIKPPLPIGTRVKTYAGMATITGEHLYSAATYLLKPDGQDDAATNTSRILMTFEKAEEAVEAQND
jgi:hypothetical protein